MKMYCITDSVDTAVGLKLTGIDTVVLEDKEEIEKNIDKVLEDQSIGILIVTDKIQELASDKLENIRNNYKVPLVVKI